MSASGVMGRLHGRLIHERRVRVLAGHFAALIPPNASVIDVGCGDGLLAEHILSLRRDVSITGVDVLVRPGARIAVTWFDGRRLPFADDSADAVLFCDVLHHTDEPGHLLQEAARVARRSIVIKDHFADGLFARPTLGVMDIAGNAPHGVALRYNYLTETQWTDAFRTCRLELLAIRRRLKLYPLPLDLVFGRSLHFVALLAPTTSDGR